MKRELSPRATEDLNFPLSLRANPQLRAHKNERGEFVGTSGRNEFPSLHIGTLAFREIATK